MGHKSKYIQSTLTSAGDQVQGSYLPANLYTLGQTYLYIYMTRRWQPVVAAVS